MPIYYNPRDFFRVAFTRPDQGSTTLYLATFRTALLMPLPITLAIIEHLGYFDDLPTDHQLDKLLTPFTLLLGLVTAFRLNDAFHKWERAGEIIYTLQREARVIFSRMSAFLPADDPHVRETVLEIRRLILLGCVLLKAHVRHENSKTVLDEAMACELLRPSEKTALTSTVTVADGPTGDGKKDKYPSRARPTYAFQKASRLNHLLFKGKHYSMPHTFWGIEESITTMSNTFEQAEHLGTSLLPLPYAQLTRFLALIFLVILPVAYARALGLFTIPLSLLANLVFFVIDECSGQMELPFGDDENDVEIEKILRRIDKLSAAQLYQVRNLPAISRSSPQLPPTPT